ncbi:MAG TPA: SH3 domain-containing protein [Firmicutes bacterium]|uniref:SH3 domain-containing protein n=1 Tax=Candidatus Fermentithermobacillus carboniphilus TaxID=3085328 RepID=A0AAT9LCI4_9FIRM|nr:MAG: SH3 domain-containing protein [Candidatus Fermentithermobacillus carboniphilus]HHW17500.1 SH3 domain-containing protein [Candidatus Fermentithermobacillaceae bacterium]
MEEILALLMEQELKAIEQYNELLKRSSGATERELIGRILAQKKFEVETLKLLRSGKVPDRFLAFGQVTEDEVNFRDAPSPSGGILAVLGRGTPVILTEKRGNWVGVQLYDGKTGWIFRDYVRANE